MSYSIEEYDELLTENKHLRERLAQALERIKELEGKRHESLNPAAAL